MRVAPGSLVGAVGGAAFVVSSAAALDPAPLSWTLRALGVAGSAVVTGYAVLIARRGQQRPELSRSSTRLYGIAVLAMLVALPLGSFVLRSLRQPDLVLAWVVVVVGAHFLPLARVFAARIFAHLALTLVVVGLLGGLLVLTLGAGWRPWTGAAAGFAVLWFSGPGAARASRATNATTPPGR